MSAQAPTYAGSLAEALQPDFKQQLLRLLQASDAHTKALQAIADRLGTPPASAPTQQAKSLAQVLSLPVSPQLLNEMLLAYAPAGYVTPLVLAEVTSVPAGQIVSGTFTVPPGYVVSLVSPFTYFSNHYDPSLTVTVIADGQPTSVLAYPINDSGSLTLPEYIFATSAITYTYANETATAAVVTWRTEYVLLQQDFYRTRYLPLIKSGYEVLFAS